MEKRLQSPVESHFAITPVSNSATSSPANGFVHQDSTQLLNDELDQLEQVQNISLQDKSLNQSIQSLVSFDTLLSPTDENISMFSRNNEQDRESIIGDTYSNNVLAEKEYLGEVCISFD